MRDIYMLKGHRLRQQHCFSKSCYSMPRDLGKTHLPMPLG